MYPLLPDVNLNPLRLSLGEQCFLKVAIRFPFRFPVDVGQESHAAFRARTPRGFRPIPAETYV